MIKKYLFYILLLITLNGCIQSSVSFIGPAYTVASTGNIYQAGLSISVNQALLHTTGENTLEYASSCLLYTSPSPRDATLSRMPSSA